MALTQIYNLGGINTYVNPASQSDGNIIHAVNVDNKPYGALSKRAGYSTFLGTADGSAVTSLFSWTKENGDLFLYRTSGSSLYYSIAGTGAWTLAGGGTVTAGSSVGYGVLGDTLILGDGAGSTRHTTSGTSFTNTTLAPVGRHFREYQRRIYIGGTSSTLFYSTTNDATNWATSGTSDSSSFTVPGEGKISNVMKIADKLVIGKTSGIMKKWDGFALVDRSTRLGPTAVNSIAEVEGSHFYLNRTGIYADSGPTPQLLSNAIEDQIYNDAGGGIAGGTFTTASGVVHNYDYLLSVGSITPSLTNELIPNAIIKYDYNKNEFVDYQFNNFPTAWCSYTDANGVKRLIFGDSSGQCYTFGGTATTDNTATIEAEVEFVIHLGAPELSKNWKYFVALFNPGCQAKIAIAVEDSFVKGVKKWTDLGDTSAGRTEFRFPQGSRGSLLFVRIYEASRNARFTCYGFAVDADVIPLR